MNETYNQMISENVSTAFGRRTKILRVRRQAGVLIAILVIALVILLGSSIRAFASAQNKTGLHKYYTSIQVQRGDTLWDIAGRYTVDGVMDRETFIEEVTALNGLTDGQIRSGDYIVVTYYTENEQ